MTRSNEVILTRWSMWERSKKKLSDQDKRPGPAGFVLGEQPPHINTSVIKCRSSLLLKAKLDSGRPSLGETPRARAPPTSITQDQAKEVNL